MKLGVLAALCAACALPLATARADDRVIPPGVTVQGVDLSNQTVDQAAAVDKAFDDSAAPRRFRQPVVKVRPKVTYKELLRKYGTVLTVDRNNFTLRLFKHLKLSKRYGIAVGMAGLETPSGVYAIHEK